VKITRTTLGVGIAISVLALGFGMGSAQADTNPGNTTTLAMVGSDTSQDVMEGMSQVIKDASNNPMLSNYKATPVGRTITTRTGNANCSFVAPRNSGEGRDALSAAMRSASFSTSANMSGCVNVARSSSGGNPTISPGVGTMTYIPFATDSVTYATLGSSTVPHQLNLADLKSIYQANGTPGSSACFGMAPLLPAFGSGTRSFFVATLLGLTDTVLPAPAGTAAPLGTCVRDTNAAGTLIQEHDGRFITNLNELAPFSVAQFIAQAGGTISDQRGRASLGSIDYTNTGASATSPISLQTTFGTGTRPLYNVVPTDALTPGSATSNVFSGPTSAVCTNTGVLQQYGLAPIATCGDTTKKNTN
jgi:hypothetical protein